jgi:hypothetical protein
VRRSRYQKTIGVEVPWERPGLSRSARVEAFLEDLTIGSGKLGLNL